MNTTLDEAKKNTKILVVDDSEFSRNAIVGALTEEGYNVVGEASSFESTLKVLVNTSCNLCIIDVIMPDASGIKLAETLIEQSANTHSPIHVIMVSSLMEEHILIDAISKGICDFLVKPFNKNDLLKSIEKVSAKIQEDYVNTQSS